MPASIPSASSRTPVEVLVQILQIACAELASSPSSSFTTALQQQQLQVAFSKVCRMWYHATVDYLRHFVVDGSAKARALRTAISDNSPRDCTNLCFRSCGEKYEEMGMSLIGLLEVCPDLTRLRIEVRNCEGWVVDGMIFPQFKALRRLEVDVDEFMNYIPHSMAQ